MEHAELVAFKRILNSISLFEEGAASVEDLQSTLEGYSFSVDWTEKDMEKILSHYSNRIELIIFTINKELIYREVVNLIGELKKSESFVKYAGFIKS